MHGAYVGNGRVLISPSEWRGKLYAPAEDMSLTPDLMIDGCFDEAFTRFALKSLDKSMTVVDIGANIGYMTVLLGKLAGKVYAYEAGKNNFEFLEQNVSMNYLRNTEIFNLAVTEGSGSMAFYEPTRFRGSGGGMAEEDREAFYESAAFDLLREQRVNTVCIDEHLAHVDYIDLIKMDIEGGEYLAFVGMQNKIQQGKIGMISYELNPSCLGMRLPLLKAMMKLYEESGAKFFTIDGSGSLIPDTLDNLFQREHVDQLVVSFI